jgi:hypothetical protein
MTRQLFEMLLEERLRKLIEKNPREAYNLLSDCPEENPDLYTIALYNAPKAWPVLIVVCDQIQTWLNRIDFKKGQSLDLDPDELPSLNEITSTIPRHP